MLLLFFVFSPLILQVWRKVRWILLQALSWCSVKVVPLCQEWPGAMALSCGLTRGLPTDSARRSLFVLSTSPFSTPTHWSQTIFTFEEPIAMAKEESTMGSSALAGTDECPTTTLSSRINIVRASEHRSIDISVETTAISSDGRKRSWPVQIFNLWPIIISLWAPCHHQQLLLEFVLVV